MTEQTAQAAPTAPSPQVAFDALGRTVGESAPGTPVQGQSESFDMGIDKEGLIATFFATETPPAQTKGAEATKGASPDPKVETAGKEGEAGPATSPSSSGTAPTAPVSSQPQTPAPVSPSAVPGVQAPSAGVPASPAEQELRLRLEGMEAELQRFRAATPQTPVTPSPVQVTGPELVAPAYNLDVPDALVAALFDEDMGRSKQGVTALVNSLATAIHANVQKEMQGYVPAVLQRYDSQQQESRQVASLNADYYGAFPSHNNPAIAQMVAQEAIELQRTTNASWSPAFRDAIGARVNARIVAAQQLGIPIAGYTPAAAPAVSSVTPAQPVQTAPAPFAPVSTREGASMTDQAQAFMRLTIQG